MYYNAFIDRNSHPHCRFTKEFIMIRWYKITENQYFGFWMMGLLLFALQEVPYMVMPLIKLGSNPIMNMQESSVLLNICEKITGISSIVLMCFILNKNVPFFDVGTGYTRIGFVFAILTLLLYYFGWFLYFRGNQSIGIMLFLLVLMPPLYYVSIGIWRQNWALATVGAVFAFIHFIHVMRNLLVSCAPAAPPMTKQYGQHMKSFPPSFLLVTADKTSGIIVI